MKTLEEIYPDENTAADAIKTLYTEMANYTLKASMRFDSYTTYQPPENGWGIQIRTRHQGVEHSFFVQSYLRLDHFLAGVNRFLKFLVEQEATHLYEIGLDRMEHLRGHAIRDLIREAKDIKF